MKLWIIATMFCGALAIPLAAEAGHNPHHAHHHSERFHDDLERRAFNRYMQQKEAARTGNWQHQQRVAERLQREAARDAQRDAEFHYHNDRHHTHYAPQGYPYHPYPTVPPHAYRYGH